MIVKCKNVECQNTFERTVNKRNYCSRKCSARGMFLETTRRVPIHKGEIDHGYRFIGAK